MDLSRPKSKTDRSPLRRSPEEWEVARIMLLEPSCPPRNLLLRESLPPPNSLSSRDASRRQGITACRPACSHHNTKVRQQLGRATSVRIPGVLKCIGSLGTSDATDGTLWDWQRHAGLALKRRRHSRATNLSQLMCSQKQC